MRSLGGRLYVRKVDPWQTHVSLGPSSRVELEVALLDVPAADDFLCSVLTGDIVICPTGILLDPNAHCWVKGRSCKVYLRYGGLVAEAGLVVI